VKENLNTKISRERFGIEVEKMLSGKRPHITINKMHELGLLEIVFKLPDGLDVNPLLWNECNRNSQYMFWFLDKLNVNEKQERLIHSLSAVLSPFHSTTYQIKRKTHSVIFHIIMESIKLSKTEYTETNLVISALSNWENCINNIKLNIIPPRKELGLIIFEGKHLWRLSLICALFQFSGYDDISEIYNLYCLIDNYIIEYELHIPENSWSITPILNGAKIIDLLQINPGPIIGKLLSEHISWMLENPTIKEESICSEHLKTFYENNH